MLKSINGQWQLYYLHFFLLEKLSVLILLKFMIFFEFSYPPITLTHIVVSSSLTYNKLLDTTPTTSRKYHGVRFVCVCVCVCVCVYVCVCVFSEGVLFYQVFLGAYLLVSLIIVIALLKKTPVEMLNLQRFRNGMYQVSVPVTVQITRPQ